MKILSKTDASLIENYSDFLELFPDAVFVETDKVYRFEQKELARWISDNLSLNDMRIAYLKNKFTLREYMQFHMDIGYSLCGFSEIFGDEMNIMTVHGWKFNDLGDRKYRDVDEE